MINRYNILQHSKTVNYFQGKALQMINSLGMLQDIILLITEIYVILAVKLLFLNLQDGVNRVNHTKCGYYLIVHIKDTSSYQICSKLERYVNFLQMLRLLNTRGELDLA